MTNNNSKTGLRFLPGTNQPNLTNISIGIHKPYENYGVGRFAGLWTTAIGYHSILLLILVVAFVLRFYKLGEWSFWIDEVFSIRFEDDGFSFNRWRQSFAVNLIQLITTTWGDNEWNARLVPALIGVISIPAIYFPLKRALGPAIALLASTFLAISPWHLYWSQNARFYSLLLLFYTLAMLFAYLGFEEDRPWYLLLSLILLGLAAKERLLALLFIPVIVSYLFFLLVLPFEKPPGLRLRNVVLYFAPGAILGLLFAGPYIRNIGGWVEGFSRVNSSPFWLVAGVVYYIGIPTVCVAIIGAVYMLGKMNRAALLFTLGAVVPVLIVAAMSLFQYAANRYLFITVLSPKMRE